MFLVRDRFWLYRLYARNIVPKFLRSRPVFSGQFWYSISQRYHCVTQIACRCCPAALESVDIGDDVSFSCDIRPILAANCLRCHGMDEGHREGDPRLDTFSGAKAQHQGRAAIVPGKPEASELLTRIKSHDAYSVMPPHADSVMPPRETCKALAAQQVDMLERWIQSRAEYQQHWAFMTPVSSPVPEFADEQCRQWFKNPIHVLFCSDFKKKACVQHRSRNPGHCCGQRPSI